tara:strand:+ start:2690 stop:2956 length:267 start_codon:yes stop_codon:yes gene_type:complete
MFAKMKGSVNLYASTRQRAGVVRFQMPTVNAALTVTRRDTVARSDKGHDTPDVVREETPTALTAKSAKRWASVPRKMVGVSRLPMDVF